MHEVILALQPASDARLKSLNGAVARRSAARSRSTLASSPRSAAACDCAPAAGARDATAVGARSLPHPASRAMPTVSAAICFMGSSVVRGCRERTGPSRWRRAGGPATASRGRAASGNSGKSRKIGSPMLQGALDLTATPTRHDGAAGDPHSVLGVVLACGLLLPPTRHRLCQCRARPIPHDAPNQHPRHFPVTTLRTDLQRALGDAYRLERELGGGGMSRVFVAEELRLERKVVVKVLSPDLAQGLSADRFEREIRTVAALQQANIVPVLTAGETDGLPFYTMPFVEGESLRARLARGPLAAGEVVGILKDVSKALGYAHQRGVVHRDI